jgi:hypothetical protein
MYICMCVCVCVLHVDRSCVGHENARDVNDGNLFQQTTGFVNLCFCYAIGQCWAQPHVMTNNFQLRLFIDAV